MLANPANPAPMTPRAVEPVTTVAVPDDADMLLCTPGKGRRLIDLECIDQGG